MINIQISDNLVPENSTAPVAIEILEQAAARTLQTALRDADLTLVLTVDAQLHALNLQFLGIDAPTDVLAFPDGEVDPETQRLYLGDVVISLPQAQSQAQTGGHSVEDELRLLVVHGVLHLLGYDHAAPEEKERMWAAQAEILSDIGVRMQLPPLQDP